MMIKWQIFLSCAQLTSVLGWESTRWSMWKQSKQSRLIEILNSILKQENEEIESWENLILWRIVCLFAHSVKWKARINKCLKCFLNGRAMQNKKILNKSLSSWVCKLWKLNEIKLLKKCEFRTCKNCQVDLASYKNNERPRTPNVTWHFYFFKT